MVERLKKTFFRWVKLIPAVKHKIDSELADIKESFDKEAKEKTKHLAYTIALPPNSLSADEVLQLARKNLKLGKNDSITQK